MAGSSPALPPGADGSISSGLGIFVRAVWAALVSPAGFSAWPQRWHKPADKWRTPAAAI
jgi:hypothetical protein